MMDGGMGWWWMGGGSLVFLALIVVVVVLLLHRDSDIHERRGTGADDILAERFARGEIDEDEYRKRRAALRG
jgi:putative membrane protein